MAYLNVDSFAVAVPLFKRAQELTPDVPYALSTELVNEAVQGHFDAAATLYRRYERASHGDSVHADEVERGLRDPSRRIATVTAMMKSDEPHIVIAFLRGQHRDGDAATVVAAISSSSQRERINAVGLFIALGPGLRASPKVRSALVRLGYPDPADGESAR